MASLETTSQVIELFRQLVSQPDFNFLTPTMAEQMCARGYEKFRDQVTQINPRFYAHSVNLSFTTYYYDLATGPVIIMGGGTLTAPRLDRPLVLGYYVTNRLQYEYARANSIDNLGVLQYALQNTKLYVQSLPAVPLTFWYNPVSEVDWSVDEYIDNLTQYHYLIALYAVQEYMAIAAESGSPQFSYVPAMIRDYETRLNLMLAQYGSGSLQERVNVL